MALAVNLMRDPKKGKAVSPNDFNPFVEKPQKIVLIHQISPQLKDIRRKIAERKRENQPNENEKNNRTD